jgi:hypothetical protein
MKERPILLSAPMVRAILEGRKTQTRRVVKGVKHFPDWGSAVGMVGGAWLYGSPAGLGLSDRGDNWSVRLDEDHLRRMCTREAYGWGAGSGCPYGQPGDRLWVRESWMPDPPNDGSWAYTTWAGQRIGQIAGVPDRYRRPEFCNYAADWPYGPVIWTPSIHMPRWASRITLEVTGVRVERLQDISEADAWAEGCEPGETDDYGRPFPADVDHGGGCTEGWDCAKDWFADLWESINSPGSWDANPWVWVVEFRRVEPQQAAA